MTNDNYVCETELEEILSLIRELNAMHQSSVTTLDIKVLDTRQKVLGRLAYNDGEDAYVLYFDGGV